MGHEEGKARGEEAGKSGDLINGREKRQ